MKLEFLGKWEQSGDSNCPAGYKTDRGTFVVQGWKVTDQEALGMVRDLGDGETVAEVPADVVRKLAAAL